MPIEVRSPNNREGIVTPNAERRIDISPNSAPRSDSFGHAAPHVGKAASSPVSLAHDLNQVAGGTGNRIVPPAKP